MSGQLTREEYDVMAHACAWKHPRSPGFRNHYVTGPDCDSWPIMTALVARGFMRVTVAPIDIGDMVVFAVTNEGKRALAESDKAEKESRR